MCPPHVPYAFLFFSISNFLHWMWILLWSYAFANTCQRHLKIYQSDKKLSVSRIMAIKTWKSLFFCHICAKQYFDALDKLLVHISEILFQCAYFNISRSSIVMLSSVSIFQCCQLWILLVSLIRDHNYRSTHRYFFTFRSSNLVLVTLDRLGIFLFGPYSIDFLFPHFPNIFKIGQLAFILRRPFWELSTINHKRIFFFWDGLLVVKEN